MAKVAHPGKKLLATSLLVIGLVLAACGADSRQPTATIAADEPTPTTPSGPVETASATPAPQSSPTPEPGDFPPPVELAIADAAAEAGVEINAVVVMSFEEREWPSTALGCPQPELSYAQVVTPGFFIQIEAGDFTFEYHTNMSTRVVLCQRQP